MNRLFNWTHNDVAQFIEQQHFSYFKSEGGHDYYKGFVDNEKRIVQVPNHKIRKRIDPKTLQHTIIPHSGIPENCWLEYVKMPRKLRKKYCYKGCKPFPKL